MSPNTPDGNPQADPCDIVELLRPLNALFKMRRQEFGSLSGLMILSAAHAADRASTEQHAEGADVIDTQGVN